MMTSILLIISFFNTILFIKNWKKLVYIFLFLLPFLGFIQHKIQPFTILSPLIHDLIFIIPLYIIIISNKVKINILPNDLKKLIYLFIFLILLQFFSPLNNVIFLARLVALKVWIFYFLCIIIGYNLITDKKDLKFFCNLLAVITIFPCIIGIIQYISSLTIGYPQTFINFYNDSEAAFGATQGFAKFEYGFIKIFRIPSTFSYVAQYLNYLIISLIPVITSINLGETNKEKFFYKLILYLVIVALILSGSRGAIVFLIIFYIFFNYVNSNIKNMRYLPLKFFFILLIILVAYNQNNYFRVIFSLSVNYVTDYLFINLFENIFKYFFGIGLGNATQAVRYIDPTISKHIHEGYYVKTLVELGFFGVVMIFVLFFNYLKQANIARQNLLKYNENIFCSCFGAYIYLQIISAFKSWVYFDGYPANFMFFILLGIILKLGTKDYLIKSYS